MCVGILWDDARVFSLTCRTQTPLEWDQHGNHESADLRQVDKRASFGREKCFFVKWIIRVGLTLKLAIHSVLWEFLVVWDKLLGKFQMRKQFKTLTYELKVYKIIKKLKLIYLPKIDSTTCIYFQRLLYG